METTFPDALVHYLNETYGGTGIEASFVEIDAVTMDGEPGYDVILDRISHEVSFYRSFLKWASLMGVEIVNNPFWWSADDKFIDNVIAARAGVAVPRSAILPQKKHPPNTDERSFRNLRYPIDWDAVFSYVGFPAFLKPHDGGGWRGVTRIEGPSDLFAAYDESDTDCMMLQEGIQFESYFRCYGIGREHVRIMRYNPDAAPDQRYSDVPDEPVPEALLARMRDNVLAICRALGYDMNTVEFAVRDGIPYAIDFMNPAPDADYASVGHENFEWVVRATADLLVSKARKPRRKRRFDPDSALGAGASTR
jgi:hypothetical protein